MIPVTSDGALETAAAATLPANATPAAVIENACNAVASATGAMVFVATQNGAMFAIDSATGAIVNSVQLDPASLVWISSDTATNQLVFNNGKTLGIIPAPDTPMISGVTAKDDRMVIEGANFLSGATVSVNGKVVPVKAGGNSGREIVPEQSSFQSGRQFPWWSLILTSWPPIASPSRLAAKDGAASSAYCASQYPSALRAGLRASMKRSIAKFDREDLTCSINVYRRPCDAWHISGCSSSPLF
jgi:hypothetical protein